MKDLTIRRQSEYIQYLLKKVRNLEKELQEVKFDRDTYQSIAICNREGRNHARDKR